MLLCARESLLRRGKSTWIFLVQLHEGTKRDGWSPRDGRVPAEPRHAPYHSWSLPANEAGRLPSRTSSRRSWYPWSRTQPRNTARDATASSIPCHTAPTSPRHTGRNPTCLPQHTAGPPARGSSSHGNGYSSWHVSKHRLSSNWLWRNYWLRYSGCIWCHWSLRGTARHVSGGNDETPT